MSSVCEVFVCEDVVYFLCRLPALAEATYRDQYPSSASASQKISVTFFSGTTQASFLIFGTEHQYGELYRVTNFWICGMSTSCLKRLWIFKRKEVGRWHMSSLEDLLLSLKVAMTIQSPYEKKVCHLYQQCHLLGRGRGLVLNWFNQEDMDRHHQLLYSIEKNQLLT